MKTSRASALGLVAALILSPLAFAIDPPPGGGYPDRTTALGEDSLFNVTTGSDDTAIGYESLYNYTGGDGANTALGSMSLYSDTTGFANSGGGYQSLYGNTSGTFNTAFGSDALLRNATGSDNVAIGNMALWYPTNGSENVAIGCYAGGGSLGVVAIGCGALGNGGDGKENVAVGFDALDYCKGSRNIAVGPRSGLLIISGSHNIDIGNQGTADDKRTIRLGNERTQTRTFIAGIAHIPVPASIPVVINQDGQLGTMPSSARFKDDIEPMNEASEAILSLQPVTFRYKKELDSLGTPQFGLVAEEVAKIDPDLVARDDSGQPYSVRYEAVNAMLLNEFLKEHRKVEAQAQLNTQQGATIATQAGEIGELRSAVAALQKTVEAQAAQIEKVSARVQAAETTPRLVSASP